MPTYQLISSNVLTSDTANVTFSSIPNTYTDLVINASVRTNETGINDYLAVRFNGLSGSVYNDTSIVANGNGSVSGNANQNVSMHYMGMINGGTSTANTFGPLTLYISSYTSSTQKSNFSFGVIGNAAASGGLGMNALLINLTSAITSIDLFPFFGSNLLSGSSFYLYGISNA